MSGPTSAQYEIQAAYRNDTLGFSLIPPKFSAKSSAPVVAIVQFHAPPEESFAANLNVTIHNCALDYFVALSDQQFNSGGVDLVSKKSTTARGRSAVEYVFDTNAGGLPLRCLAIAIDDAGRVQVVTGTSLEMRFTYYARIFLDTVESLTFGADLQRQYKEQAMSAYRNDTFGFSLTPPKFASKSAEPAVWVVTFNAPPEDNFSANLTVQVNNGTLDDVNNGTLDGFLTKCRDLVSWGEMEIVSTKLYALGTYSAVETVYKMNENGNAFQLIGLGVDDGQRVQVFTFAALEMRFREYERVFRDALGSLTFDV
jgi:hypothetical protein